jgi:hypothetical protein
VIPPPGFAWVPDTRTPSLVRADLRTWLLPVLRAAADGWRGYDTQSLPGGRGGTRLIRLA